MTIKTLKSTSEGSKSIIKSNGVSASDMMQTKRSGAVKNLFNTTVDRDELQQQLKSLERESYRALSNFKYDSKISEIRRDDEDQARRLKYLPAKKEALDKRHVRGTSQKTLQSMILTREKPSPSTSASSSSSSSISRELFKSTSTSNSKLLSVHKPSSSTSSSINLNLMLPKGQRTIKDYYHTVKRSRQNR